MSEAPGASVRVLGSRQAAAHLSRRSVLAGLAAAGAGLVITGCGRSDKVAANIAPDGKLEDKLNIYTWGDYDDPALLKKFRKDFDVIVQVDSFGSNEELTSKLGASRGTSGYDVVVPSGLMIPQMADRRLLQQLDHSLLPNLAKLSKEFVGQPYDPHNDYSVIKCWGTTGFVYDTKAIDEDLTSWKDFVTAATGTASGKVAVLEDAWETVCIGLGAHGYDLNTTKKSELDAAHKIVVDELAPHIKAYVGSASTAMTQGGFTLMQAYNGDARQGILEADDPDRWKFVFAEPSANLWTDTWAIATGAPHPDAAHAFINWIIAPDQALKEVDYIGYPTGAKVLENKKVEEDFDYPELIFPSRQILDRLTPQVFNAGQQRRVDILTAAQARSGA